MGTGMELEMGSSEGWSWGRGSGGDGWCTWTARQSPMLHVNSVELIKRHRQTHVPSRQRCCSAMSQKRASSASIVSFSARATTPSRPSGAEAGGDSRVGEVSMSTTTAGEGAALMVSTDARVLGGLV